MAESRPAEVLRHAGALERAQRRRRGTVTPERDAHQWWLDLVARRLARNRST